MRIQFFSDLHLECWRARNRIWHIPDIGADVIVLAGDIDTRLRGVDWALAESERLGRPILYVFGNHEYYGGHLGLLDKAKKRVAGSRVRILENDTVVMDGVCFVGATLWTDFDLYGNAPLAGFDAQRTLSDYHKIRAPPKFRKLLPEDVIRLHAESRRFLETCTGKAECVVAITHHAPSERSIPSVYRGWPTNPAYASRLDELVSRFDLWIHGHVHHPADYRIGRCRVVSNPFGYFPDDGCSGFRDNYTVTI